MGLLSWIYKELNHTYYLLSTAKTTHNVVKYEWVGGLLLIYEDGVDGV